MTVQCRQCIEWRREVGRHGVCWKYMVRVESDESHPDCWVDRLRVGSRSSTAGASTASRNSSMSSDSPRSSVVTPDDARD